MGTVLGGRDKGGGWRGTVGGGGSGFKEGIWHWEGQKGLLITSTIHAIELLLCAGCCAFAGFFRIQSTPEARSFIAT